MEQLTPNFENDYGSGKLILECSQMFLIAMARV
jgi:hypothetical protein